MISSHELDVFWVKNKAFNTHCAPLELDNIVNGYYSPKSCPTFTMKFFHLNSLYTELSFCQRELLIL
jgi:hypothetical protein